ncbi:hypothetical protein DAEQUDRAFT_726929 [Daedalea quercina L-15889]|uniref:Uncharacterized protein n=1 Tax=Daedalea quercina L-15889 TaxID=1314783 RepID=A0A165QE95_9APHY|nr:hypothetical protein DAEQUDRAFT_726929 [Daedalea quercina L-15889]
MSAQSPTDTEEPPPPYSAEDPSTRQDDQSISDRSEHPIASFNTRSVAPSASVVISIQDEMEVTLQQEGLGDESAIPNVAESDIHAHWPPSQLEPVSRTQHGSELILSNPETPPYSPPCVETPANHLDTLRPPTAVALQIIPISSSNSSPQLTPRRPPNAHSISAPDLSAWPSSTDSTMTSSSSAESAGKQDRYKIGSHKITESLVDLEHIKAHLNLLGAFRNMRNRVEDCPDTSLPEVAQFLDGSQRWAWFVGLALERFHRWVKNVKQMELATWITDEIPPLDVMMIWHAYMLNPIWYAEDCDRIPLLRTLKSFDAYFIPALMLMGEIKDYEPSEQRILSWFEQTDTAFDAILSMQFLLHRNVRCPGCGRTNDILFLTEEGTGYLQRNFRYVCICGLSITKTALALDKFVSDLVSSYRAGKVEPENCLAGCLHTRAEAQDWHHAVIIKRRIIGDPGSAFLPAFKITRGDWKKFIKERFGYSISNLPTASVARLPRTMNAYTDDRPFSVDLVAAVLRQGNFIDAMDNLGWTRPGYFDDRENEVLLTHALARYHAFLDLLSSASGPHYVPTFDIDLVWHTHQLKGNLYLKECKKLVGWYVDHDDRVEENYLLDGLDETCRAWQQRFGVPYMHCGCPLPDESVVSKLSQFTRRHGLSSSKDCAALQLPQHPGAPDATHASEHDVVRTQNRIHPASVHNEQSQRERRAQEMRRRRDRDGRRVLEGKMDVQLYRRGLTHISTSIMPVPFAVEHPGPSERWAAPCVVTFPGAFGTTGVGTCIAGINTHI